MEPDFWHRRWSKQQTAFHQPDGHPMLNKWWPTLELDTDAHVLVPLCGKTPDLRTLAERGHRVTGIELSPIAAQDFFVEQHLSADSDETEDFERYRAECGAGSIEILVGDFFAASAETLGAFDAFYDRAALIALPEAMRSRYVEHLLTLLTDAAPGLLITLDYDQSQMNGPPFAVGEDEVNTLFESCGEITLLENGSRLGGKDMLAERGVQSAEEYVYRLAAPG
ncbi:thiopurine S-methyltransferase [Salinisphaera sp.]|uniref:thiopurine S-methyltransferase n=1 Tax=Salinisphaera sp. TaxID=1914330 RepID=UPI000C6730E8|nr:thiopurine S-methyltransferase [Salinisphaera sp.]MBS64551.1 thiopurine S-methyltransferase [Salinisphaera sp.]